MWAATLPVFVLAGAAIPTALMTDGRAGYVTLGSGVGMAGGWLLGVFAGSALGALAPGDGGAVLVGAGVGATVLGTLGGATGALLAAHLDINGQEMNGWTLIPTYLPQGHAPGLAFSGQF